jgi:hypothetical protein
MVCVVIGIVGLVALSGGMMLWQAVRDLDAEWDSRGGCDETHLHVRQPYIR